MKNLLHTFICGLIVLLATQSCAPVFSELQSARMTGAGQVELTPHYSSTSVADGGDSEGIQNHLGLQLAVGVSPKVDLRFRYENIWLKGDGVTDGLSLIAFGPKLSLIPDQLALYAPIGTAVGDGITDSWQFQPTVFVTLPVVPQKLDFTVAPKMVVSFCDDCNSYFAFNTGLAISSNITRWAFRPEFGLLFGEDGGTASHLSFGISFNVSRPK